MILGIGCGLAATGWKERRQWKRKFCQSHATPRAPVLLDGCPLA